MSSKDSNLDEATKKLEITSISDEDDTDSDSGPEAEPCGKKTDKPALIPAANKPASRYGQLAPKGLKSKLLGRLQGNSRQYFDSGDYNGDKTARRPSAPKLVPALKHAPLMRKLSRECPQRKEPVEYKETPLARTSQGSCESSPKITKKITE